MLIVRIGAIAVLLFLLGGVLINGCLMLISPRIWFRLPGWLRAVYGISPNRYSSGWGAVQIRLAGLVFLGILFAVLFSVMSRNHT